MAGQVFDIPGHSVPQRLTDGSASRSGIGAMETTRPPGARTGGVRPASRSRPAGRGAVPEFSLDLAAPDSPKPAASSGEPAGRGRIVATIPVEQLRNGVSFRAAGGSGGRAGGTGAGPADPVPAGTEIQTGRAQGASPDADAAGGLVLEGRGPREGVSVRDLPEGSLGRRYRPLENGRMADVRERVGDMTEEEKTAKLSQLKKSAEEYEGMLLNEMIKSMRQSPFVRTPGDDTYSEIAEKPFTAAITAAGGLGLSQTIVSQVASQEGLDDALAAHPEVMGPGWRQRLAPSQMPKPGPRAGRPAPSDAAGTEAGTGAGAGNRTAGDDGVRAS